MNDNSNNNRFRAIKCYNNKKIYKEKVPDKNYLNIFHTKIYF